MHRVCYVDNFIALVSYSEVQLNTLNSSLFTILFIYRYSLLHVRPDVGHLQGETQLQETHVTLTCVHLKCRNF